MNGFGRTLRYFLYRAQIYALCIMLGGAAMAVYKWAVQDHAGSFRDLLAAIPVTWMPILSVVLFSVGTSFGYFFSMLVSFGCRRIHVILGNLAMNLLLILECVFFSWLLTSWLGKKESVMYQPMILGALFLLEGLTQLIGAAMAKWGKNVYLIFVFFVFVIAFLAGILVQTMHIQNIIDVMFLHIGQEWIILAGAAICMAEHLIVYRFMRNYEVKV